MIPIAVLVLCVLFTTVVGKSPQSPEDFQQIVQRLEAAVRNVEKNENHSQRATPTEEAGLDVEELVEYYGYPEQTYETVTEDGYILAIHRITHGLMNADDTDKPVVLLVPGLLCSAGVYLINGGDRSLAFVLAEQGYDVWIANPRGTTYSRKHLTLDPDKDKSSFWDFSFNEIGYYDAPATIDFILAETGQEKLFYIGHSQGTSTFYAMTSQRPEYNDKIRLMVALAPIGYMSHMEHPLLKVLAENKDILNLLATTANFYEFLPHWDFITTIGEELCSDGTDTQQLCVDALAMISGSNEKEVNKHMLPVALSQFPSGASLKQLIHYAQEIMSGNFRKYDYGLIKNLIVYGKTTPPDYPLSSITAPVALFYGQQDWFASITDVEQLGRELPNVVYKYLVEDDEFTHLDFVFAIDLNTLVHDKVIALMKNY